MKPSRILINAAFGLLLTFCAALPASAWEMAGSKEVVLHTREGQRVALGSVTFADAANGRTGFTLKLDQAPFKDYFLSMKEFKCLEGKGEIFCHVAYPYPSPATIAPDDFAWLEHALLFLYKPPSEFGAKLWNGIYFKLRMTDAGLVGLPQAIDLNLISAPPATPGVPPYSALLRDDIAPDARWFNRITIE